MYRNDINTFLKILRVCSVILFAATIPLLAQAPLEIWEIQGTTERSPFHNNFVRSENNIVTSVKGDYFTIQTPLDRSDDNIQSSDGILVSEIDAEVQVGDLVNVEGFLTESNDGTTILLVEDDPTIVLSSGNDVPPALLITDDYPLDENREVPVWEWVEGMLIDLSNFSVTAPSNEDGFCYVTPRKERAFREAGIEYPSFSNLPEWDGNPEVIPFFPTVFGLSPNEQLGGGMGLSGRGIVLGSGTNYVIAPLIYAVSGDYIQYSARAKEDQEATIGNINTLLMFDDNSNYNFRLEKLAKYVLEGMGAPDIVAFQEIGSLSVLNDLVDRIQELDADQVYTADLRQGSGSIQTGFLVKNTVTIVEIQQLGSGESLSIGGRKHDRPPLLLKANLNTNPPTPIAVLNVHMRSLNGIEGSDQNFVRVKRHEQAISVAGMVEALQTQYQNIFVVGDFNAFQFSDGYVDIVNQITGQPSLGAQFEPVEVLDEPLTNYSLTVPDEEQYSYVFRGNSQILDHCLGTSDLFQMQFDELQYIRGNADVPEFLQNVDTQLRVSDHDGFVAYFDLESALSTEEVVVAPPLTPSDVAISHPNPFVAGNVIQFNLSKKENIKYELVSMNGVVVQSDDLGSIETGIYELPIEPSMVTGVYILKIRGSETDYITKIFIVN